MDAAIYKNKITGLFYILRHGDEDNKTAIFMQINDRYDYTIPWDDMELWIEIQVCYSITLC